MQIKKWEQKMKTKNENHKLMLEGIKWKEKKENQKVMSFLVKNTEQENNSEIEKKKTDIRIGGDDTFRMDGVWDFCIGGFSTKPSRDIEWLQSVLDWKWKPEHKK